MKFTQNEKFWKMDYPDYKYCSEEIFNLCINLNICYTIEKL